MSEVRICHVSDPKRPFATDGRIKIELNGQELRIPPKGQDLVITVAQIEYNTRVELHKENQQL